MPLLLRFALALCTFLAHTSVAQAQEAPRRRAGFGALDPLGMLATQANVAKAQEAPRYNLGFGTCGPIPSLPQELVHHPETMGHTTDATLRLHERLLVGASFTYYRNGGSLFQQDSTVTTGYRPLLNPWADGSL